MKNRIAYRLMPLALTLCLLLALASFAACSCGKTDEESIQEQVNGTQSTWQKLTVLVPDGMDLVGGSAFDPTDTNTAWIQRRGDELTYFRMNIVSKESAESDIETTRKLNSCEDVEFKTGNIQWQGVKYKYAGVSDCFQVYASVNGQTVLVSGSRIAVDSPEARAVLGSIKIAE